METNSFIGEPLSQVSRASARVTESIFYVYFYVRVILQCANLALFSTILDWKRIFHIIHELLFSSGVYATDRGQFFIFSENENRKFISYFQNIVPSLFGMNFENLIRYV